MVPQELSLDADIPFTEEMTESSAADVVALHDELAEEAADVVVADAKSIAVEDLDEPQTDELVDEAAAVSVVEEKENLEAAQAKECWVVTEPREPFKIVNASANWFKTWEFEPDEAIGKSIRIINGDGAGHDHDAAGKVMKQMDVVKAGDKTCPVRCCNEAKSGRYDSPPPPSVRAV